MIDHFVILSFFQIQKLCLLAKSLHEYHLIIEQFKVSFEMQRHSEINEDGLIQREANLDFSFFHN